MNKLRVLDLFSGIGGFSLGLERTGEFETVAFCEIEDFPRRVLAKHWPEVPCYHDVRELTASKLAADGIAVDVICGGFPCQDISYAGDGAGLEGERSGLWSEIARLVDELRPSYVIVENVAALLGRGLDRVLGDLASVGYDAEWHCIPASAIGARHIRDRIWIVAYPCCLGYSGKEATCAAAHHEKWNLAAFEPKGSSKPGEIIASSQILANAILSRFQGAEFSDLHRTQFKERQERSSWTASQRGSLPIWGGWRVEPGMGRVADGIPDRAHRLKGLGNAVVPQIPELIGYAILEAIARKAEGEVA